MNPYRAWVAGFAAALAHGAAVVPAGTSVPLGMGRKALVFAPHPDDEVIIGGLPLRLRREAGFAVTVVAVTLGSAVGRRAARWGEQAAACAALGFGLVTPDRAGLDGVTLAGRAAGRAQWGAAVAKVAALIEAEGPAVVFVPHEGDWHQTHIGTHLLVTEAMRLVPGLDVAVVETEFWGAMGAPNLMVESSVDDVAALVEALALHVGEVARNPYHLRLPAWMMDNVRRGAELVGGQGGVAPAMTFATLYRVRRWREGVLQEARAGGAVLEAGVPASVMEASLGLD